MPAHPHSALNSARRAATTAALFSGGALFAYLLFDNLNESNFF